MGTTAAAPSKHTNGFFVQAIASFGISSVALVVGVLYLDTSIWIRAFLLVAIMYLITSTITMSKVVRDREEAAAIHHRVDAARLERVLAEFDPLGDLHRSMGTAPPPVGPAVPGPPPLAKP